MKRHGDDIINKNKRFSFTNDNRPPPQPSPHSSSFYSYQTPVWADPRADIKPHIKMNMFQSQNMMMQWNNPSSAMYNPMQPPPPLPLDRPPCETPPPPPPQSPHPHQRRNLNMNNNMRRPPSRSLRPDQQGYMNLGPYKKNMNHMNHQNHQSHLNHQNHPNHQNHQNHQNHSLGQKNGSNLNMPGTSAKPKMNDGKMEDVGAKPALKVNKKARRKPMSERYTCKKEWNKEDAHKALTLENAYNHLIKKVPMLILRFPDPELNKALIHSYSSAIETVHFQQPSRARYCFVQLKPDADIEQVKKQISQIEFGTGKISVENKITRHEVSEVTPEQLDPYTLYVGNLPTKLNVTIFKEKFPTAKRIDIGYAQRTKFTRYAFLHYDSVEDSMEAFKSTYNLTIDARSLVVRFRRNKGSVGLSEKGKKPKKEEPDGAEGAESTEGDKTDAKNKTGAVDLDNEIDSKANVKEKAEELRKQGFGLNTSTEDNLLGTNVKQEPVSDDELHSEDGYGFDGDNDAFDEDEKDYMHSDYDGSDGEGEFYDENEYDNSEPAGYTSENQKHWERIIQPDVSNIKEEKPDDDEGGNNQPPKQMSEAKAPDDGKDNDDDDLDDDLFNGLNPDDGLGLGLDDL